MARLEIDNPLTGHDVIEFDKALAGSPATKEALRIFSEKVGVEKALAITRKDGETDGTVARTFNEVQDITRFQRQLQGG